MAFALRGPWKIGLDVECVETNDAKMRQRIMTAKERSSSARTALSVTMHFSAKEAIYKSLPEGLQHDLDFDDIELDMRDVGDGWSAVPCSLACSLDVEVLVTVRGLWIVSIARTMIRKSKPK